MQRLSRSGVRLSLPAPRLLLQRRWSRCRRVSLSLSLSLTTGCRPCMSVAFRSCLACACIPSHSMARGSTRSSRREARQLAHDGGRRGAREREDNWKQENPHLFPSSCAAAAAAQLPVCCCDSLRDAMLTLMPSCLLLRACIAGKASYLRDSFFLSLTCLICSRRLRIQSRVPLLPCSRWRSGDGDLAARLLRGSNGSEAAGAAGKTICDQGNARLIKATPLALPLLLSPLFSVSRPAFERRNLSDGFLFVASLAPSLSLFSLRFAPFTSACLCSPTCASAAGARKQAAETAAAAAALSLSPTLSTLFSPFEAKW